MRDKDQGEEQWQRPGHRSVRESIKGVKELDEKDFRDIYLKGLEDNEWEENTLPLRQMMACYRCALMEIETKLSVLNEEFSLRYDRNPIEYTETRLKSLEGIIRKLKKKEAPFTPESIEENIWDIAGVRVICSFPEEVYLIEKCLLDQDDVHLIRRRDYINQPKPNGYSSLHLVVEVPIFLKNEKKWMKTEVQIRTLAMDLWASLEHKLRYKKKLDEETEVRIEKELKRVAETCRMLDKEMENIKHMVQGD